MSTERKPRKTSGKFRQSQTKQSGRGLPEPAERAGKDKNTAAADLPRARTTADSPVLREHTGTAVTITQGYSARLPLRADLPDAAFTDWPPSVLLDMCRQLKAFNRAIDNRVHARQRRRLAAMAAKAAGAEGTSTSHESSSGSASDANV